MIKDYIRNSEVYQSGKPFKVADLQNEKYNRLQIQRALWQLSHYGEIDHWGSGTYALHTPPSPIGRLPWRTVDNRTLFGGEYDAIMGCHA